MIEVTLGMANSIGACGWAFDISLQLGRDRLPLASFVAELAARLL